jgi:hypothetical protein
MTDYLLKFPTKLAAEQFGFANGFASENEDGEIISTLASHEHALCEIGEHNGDGQWWVLFRDLVGIQIPAGGEEFIHWSSASSEKKPTDESTPLIFWA